MQKRIFSLETEYALCHDVTNKDQIKQLSAHQVYDAIEEVLLNQHAWAKCDPSKRQHTAGGYDPSLVEFKEGFFLSNGARIYNDTGHLEWAAPETSDPFQALIYDIAAMKELAEASMPCGKNWSNGRLMVVKNNLDYQSGVTYGCHENYSVKPYSQAGRNIMDQVVDCLLPFLVTRQIICGAGRIGSFLPPFGVFQLSQRSDFIFDVASVDTREKRPIVNLRDEPLADAESFMRLHLILGDSNMAELPSLIKLGATGILLSMIETDSPLPRLSLLHPKEAIRKVSRDLTFYQPLALENGGSMTAVAIQREYWKAAHSYVSDNDHLYKEIIIKWGMILDALEHNDASLELHLDWAYKRSLLSEMLARQNTGWDELDAWEPILAATWQLPAPVNAPKKDWISFLRRRLSKKEFSKVCSHACRNGLNWSSFHHYRHLAATLRELDIRYHDINPEKGLFYRGGGTLPIVDSPLVKNAQAHAPKDTRAFVRAEAIEKANRQNEPIVTDWNLISLPNQGLDLELPNPLDCDSTLLASRLGLSNRTTAKPHLPGKEDLPRIADPIPTEEDDEITIEILSIDELNPKEGIG